jgi:serine/threonine protein phosphatase PrpC
MDCPNCGERAPDEASWCEACGADLSAAPSDPCVACGEREVSDDGYCMACGHKQPAPRDHQEASDGPVVAVSDRGRRHHHNEDAFAIGSLPDGTGVLVVCDGVSSTPGSDEASLRASVAARDLLVERLGADSGSDVVEILNEAVASAQQHASEAPELDEVGPYGTSGPPSSTLVAAVAQPGDGPIRITVAWVGDSRAYWIGADDRLLLTEDHELGGSLVRWLGADSMEPVPDLSQLEAETAGTLVVCSDGLWRYADKPDQMAELIDELAGGQPSAALLSVAGGMVQYAIDGGGHDNITVALWASPETPPPDLGVEPGRDGAGCRAGRRAVD